MSTTIRAERYGTNGHTIEQVEISLNTLTDSAHLVIEGKRTQFFRLSLEDLRRLIGDDDA